MQITIEKVLPFLQQIENQALAWSGLVNMHFKKMLEKFAPIIF